jgi:ribonuclease T2
MKPLRLRAFGGLASVALAALSLCAEPMAPGARAATVGDFDFYVLALSWSPGFCNTGGADKAREQCATGAKLGFVVHGLWPQNDHGWPQNCGQGGFPTRAQLDSIRGLFPEEGLARHEWQVHGTCSGRSPADYFADVRQARQLIKIPDAYVAPASEQTVATLDVARAFMAVNPGLRLDTLAVTCRSGTLEEVRICLSKDLRQFRTCTEVAQNSCRTRSLEVPPVH